MAAFIANGTVPAWERFPRSRDEAPHDALPATYHAIDLRAPDAVVEGLKAAQCAFWLGHGFYETRGLIN